MNNKSTLALGCISATTIGIITGAINGLSGALLSGDRIRANYNTEDAEDRQRRNGLISKILLFAFPYALISGALYFIN